jgi:uncharacterized protein YfaS (alpha-2-macroglobulin family)
MLAMSKGKFLGVLVAVAAAAWLFAGQPSQQEQRDKLHKTMQAGNWKDAYDGLRKLALDPKDDPAKVGDDLTQAITCLQNLGRMDEIDDFREAVIDVHKKNWRLLESAAQSYANVQHWGFMIAGKYHRGQHRGGGRYIISAQRDRVRALQLMQEALEQTKTETDKKALGQFHLRFAQMILHGGGQYEPWRLQYLTDLSQLPDYEEGNTYYGGNQRGAPVDAEGKPLYYKTPASYEKAANDGERWRWMLSQAVEFDPGLVNDADMALANFMRSQLGVQTMAYYGWRQKSDDDTKKDESGTFALHTLKDSETIARIANGIKRFAVPDEFNWIAIYERVAGRGKSTAGEQARDALAQEYEDRRQYVKAAAAWNKAILEYGVGVNNARQRRLDQIVMNWGRFEPLSDQPAGTKATVDFRYRNGNKVSFEAFAIDVPTLLADVKAHLKSSPNFLDWNKINLGNIGYMLVEQRQEKYIGKKVATWDMDLKPRPNHVDERITVTTPLEKPGAYLVTAQMKHGNTSRIIIWVADTVIVKKQLDHKALYYVADAVTGKPIDKANVEFFGWKQVQVKPNTNQFRVETINFAENTDKDGQIILGENRMPNQNQWVITARDKDRLAYLGFSHVWFGQHYDPEYNQTKVFTMTDRPVYRPMQTVQFKFWVRHAKYDEPNTSDFAGKTFTVEIRDPKNEKILEKNYTADEYGGIAGEFPLSKTATLGVYALIVKDHGGGSFRVEEYKKPEYEVTVEAPKEPIGLGDQTVATIHAKYYFGAPVINARVKYKVTRTAYSSTWYPIGLWDWFYGRGYWWFCGDYLWYPGWARWGCARPAPWWWGVRHEPPEIVVENEVAIGPDGTVKVPIDTAPAKALHPDQDHKYTITAEVVDESRRTIVGTGDVLVARQPFRVFAWVNRGHYRAGDDIKASFKAQTLDGKPVQGTGELKLLKITYDDKNEPVEKMVQTWKLDTNVEGMAHQQMKAAEPGQYRLSYTVWGNRPLPEGVKEEDRKATPIEGGYLFVVRGEGFDGKSFRFNDLELVTDKREYQPGDKVRLLINTNKEGGTVLLFLRPTNGIYLPPKVIRLKGKTEEEDIGVVQKDMPNFYIEALTVADGKLHTETREIVVPPEKRVLTVEVQPSAQEYRPGQKAAVKVKLTDLLGKPFVGTTVLTMYDKSVEYISGGSNVPEIKEFFWKWRRHHYPQTEASIHHNSWNLLRQGEIGMNNLGVFGEMVVEETRTMQNRRKRDGADREEFEQLRSAGRDHYGGMGMMGGAGGPMAPAFAARSFDGLAKGEGAAFGYFAGDKAKDGKQANGIPGGPGQEPQGVQPTIRKNFADTAVWNGALTTDKDGVAEVSLTMPENLTGWKVRVWAMGHGTKVGQGEAEVVTKKDLIVRLQAPRFFMQKDEVVLSANVHNYLKTEKLVTVSLNLAGGTLASLANLTQQVSIPAGGEKRVDWRVRVENEGEAVVRVKAVTDEESDAMEMRFPSYIHGMLKTDSFSGVVRYDKDSASITLTVPPERRVNESRLEVRYSPTLAGAMVDALPYMVEYPYGCTEQTLNRFLPTVVTLRVLQRMNLDLKAIRDKRTNLNSQEIGDDKERAKGWKRFPRNPVFDEQEVLAMARAGVMALQNMQCADGGWGWFSGFGEHSWPHTTAVVVHGLQIARENDIALLPNVLERGVEWLKNYQAQEIQKLQNAPTKTHPWKEHADELDAFVYMVLVDAGADNGTMRDFLYRDRTHIAVYAKAMFGLALHRTKQADKLAMILKNIEQFVVQDAENQSAYLKLPNECPWWTWYGSDVEANAYYLKLLAKTNPKDEKASGLVKYLLNNRKHATYWNSTRDTAIAIEAMADYLKASGEDKPDMTVEIWLDGKKQTEAKIDASNLFTFDNQFVLTGDAVEAGKHSLEIKRRAGSRERPEGPVYFNAYLTNFTLEDYITKAGLEVKVQRKFYKLTPVAQTIKVQGSRGQAADQKVEKYERTELPNFAVLNGNFATLKSGDLIEVELEIDSKNDYEYIIFEDMKASGFEPLLVRSGYNANDLGAYMELRDDRVSFFVRALARGKHSVSYRLRAEIPGKFSSLPTRAYAMYAPELKGNSDEMKVAITD